MTIYIGYICQALIVIIPLFILIFCRDRFYMSVLSLMCFACTYGYSYELFGAISLLHILLVYVVVFKPKEIINKFNTFRFNISIDIFIYIIYVSIVTIIGYYFRNDYILKGSIIQNQLRPYVQIVFMLMTYLAVDSVCQLDADKSKRIIYLVYRTFIVLALIGIVQEILFLATGIDLFPMMKDYAGSSGISVVASNSLLRATAGVGEPKQLAKFLAFGFVIQLIGHEYLGYERVQVIHLAIFLIGIICTGSTTGILIAACGVVFYIKSKVRGRVSGTMTAILIMMAVIPIVLSIPEVQAKFSYAALHGEIPGFENSDTATVKWLLNNPLYMLSGIGLSNTVAYANEYAPWASSYINSYPYTLRRGLIFHLAETGIVGLFLQIHIFKRMHSRINSDAVLSNLVLFFEFTYFFLTLEAINQFLLILMALLSNCYYRINNEV